ncbi:MAG: M56 family metallopeptidase, partial [Cytophagaceae bacterium]
QILRHERVHVRQRHSLDMLMAEGVCIVFWLNPAAYLFRRLVHQTLEFCADQAVLAEGIDARTYQYNLLKVSMTSGSLPITNSFSASQLHDRIRMINRQRSRWFHALKYPVVMTLSLTMVTAFARHKAEQVATQVAVPIAQSINALSAVGPSPISKQDTALQAKAVLKISATNPTALSNTVISHNQLALPDSSSAVVLVPAYEERPSDSRLVLYRGDFLYWIITPKTTLEDFSQLQKELAKHRNKLQLKSIKYDPSFSYIDQIDVQVAQIGGGSAGSWDTTADGGKPIKTIAGYLSVGSQRGSRGIGSLIDFPEELRQVAFSDEAAVKTELDTYGNEYRVRAGELTFRSVGNGSTRYDRAYFDNKSTRGSGVLVKSDKSLEIDDDSKT